MLTQHLRQMEQDGLIVRSDLSGKVPHVEYSLSASLGRSVVNLIDFLAQWGIGHSVPMPVKTCSEIDHEMNV